MMGFATAGAFASKPVEMQRTTQVNSNPLTGASKAIAPTIPDSKSATTTVFRPSGIPDAFLTIVPGAAGNCPAPANGGVTTPGCRFVLDLIVNAGSNAAPDGITAQQSYLTFTHQLIQNARVSTIGTSCTVTNTVTGDLTVFDAILQNEVCNGPAQCNFRGLIVDPGSIAAATGALTNCPEGCPDGDHPDPAWRVAQIGICANNPGLARLHWQFSSNQTCNNGAPATRDTEVVAFDGDLVQNCLVFVDYTFTIQGAATDTPTVTNTPTNTPVNTATNTNTPVNTATNTNTPVNTATNTNTPVNTATNTNTPVNTATNTNTPVNTATRTNTPINTATNTNTPVNTATNTNTPVNTATNTNTPVNTATRTNTPVNTATNTPVNTATNTPTRTRTNTPTNTPTNTFTNTPGITNTPTPTSSGTPCDICNLYFADLTISCNPNGTVHWSLTIQNNGDCTVTNVPIRVQLQTRNGFGGSFTAVETIGFTANFPPEATTIQGDICHHYTSTQTQIRLYSKIDIPCDDGNADHLSEFIDACEPNPTCTLSPGENLSDVKSGDAFYTAISGAANTGVVSGFADGSFRPADLTTRGQLAKIVVLAFGLSTKSNGTAHFSDVAASDPFFAYVEAAYNHGLISGYGDGTFRPYTTVTRGQVAKMIVLAAGWTLVNPTTATFKDVAVGSSYYTYVETAYANKVISGYADGTFRPGAGATRGQIAQITMVASTPQFAKYPNGVR
jgi:hypothetical protein